MRLGSAMIALFLGCLVYAVEPNKILQSPTNLPSWFSGIADCSRQDIPIQIARVAIENDGPALRKFRIIFKNVSAKPILTARAILELPVKPDYATDATGTIIGIIDHGIPAIRLCFTSSCEQGLLPGEEAIFTTMAGTHSIEIDNPMEGSMHLTLSEVRFSDNTCWPGSCPAQKHETCW